MINDIKKVVVLGHLGFIGGCIYKRFAEKEGISVTGASYPEYDFTREEDAARLKELFDMNTAVVMCSGIKPSIANDFDSFNKNVQMVINVCKVLEDHPVKRFIFFSSAAVYGEDVHNLGIHEHSAIDARSYYGMAKYVSECLLRKSISKYEASSILSFRPPAIYGPGDDDFSYTPSGFMKKILNNQSIELWGDGEELREFVYVDDVVKLTDHFLLNHDYSGALNIASGKSHSFKQSINMISDILQREVHVTIRPRSKSKVDNVFDGSLLKVLYYNFRFTSLMEGLKLTLNSMR